MKRNQGVSSDKLLFGGLPAVIAAVIAMGMFSTAYTTMSTGGTAIASAIAVKAA